MYNFKLYVQRCTNSQFSTICNFQDFPLPIWWLCSSKFSDWTKFWCKSTRNISFLFTKSPAFRNSQQHSWTYLASIQKILCVSKSAVSPFGHPPPSIFVTFTMILRSLPTIVAFSILGKLGSQSVQKSQLQVKEMRYE